MAGSTDTHGDLGNAVSRARQDLDRHVDDESLRALVTAADLLLESGLEAQATVTLLQGCSIAAAPRANETDAAVGILRAALARSLRAMDDLPTPAETDVVTLRIGAWARAVDAGADETD